MSEVEDYRFVTTNPCGELPLMDYGACLLGSINLSEFVRQPFTSKASFDMVSFIQTVHTAVYALDEVVDENIPLHPLQGQRDYASMYRPIGLGVMGIADMLLKLNMQYGTDESIKFCKVIGKTLINEAVHESALLAEEKGSFPMCCKHDILNSLFAEENLLPHVKALVEKHGLRNAQLLAIAPTGSLSTMLGVSGGIEPIYQTSYTRKVESLGDEDEFYKVTTPVVKEWIQNGNGKEEDVITAMNVDPIARVNMQSAWQQYIDNAISSTVNLPEDATVEDVKNIYMHAWKKNLKGITIYRDKCKRSGVLGNFTQSSKQQVELCPECNGEMIKTGGCSVCNDCGFSPCTI